MKNKYLKLIVLLFSVILFAAACGGGDATPTPESAATPESAFSTPVNSESDPERAYPAAPTPDSSPNGVYPAGTPTIIPTPDFYPVPLETDPEGYPAE